MQRVEVMMPDQKEVYVSAYKDNNNKQLVCVVVNEGNTAKYISFNKKDRYKKTTMYVTDDTGNLAKQEALGDDMLLPAKSVTTVVLN